MPMRWHVTDAATVQAMPNCEDAIACAISFKTVCVVLATVSMADSQKHIVEHEAKHCDGFTHH